MNRSFQSGNVERASSTWARPVGKVGRTDRNRYSWLGPLRLISLSSELGSEPDAGSAEEAGYSIRMKDRMWDLDEDLDRMTEQLWKPIRNVTRANQTYSSK